MKVLVNQIGAVHRQRQDEISLAQIAYYVLLKKTSSTVIRELREGRLIQEHIAPILGDGLQEALAALAFGVPKERAQQFLLEPPIVDALTNGDASALNALIGAEGFQEVLEQVIRRLSTEWPATEGGRFLQPVATMVRAGVVSDAATFRTDQLLQELGAAARRSSSLAPLTQLTEEGLLALIGRFRDERLADRLAITYRQTLAVSDPPADENATEALVDRLLRLSEGYRHVQGLDPTLLGAVPIPGSIDAYLRVCRELLRRHEADASLEISFVRPAGKPAAMAAEFEQLIAQGAAVGPEHRLAVDCATDFDMTGWAPVIQAAANRLSGGTTLSATELVALVGILLDHSTTPVGKGALKLVATNGALAHHVNDAAKRADGLGIAVCVHAHLLGQPRLVPTSHLGNSQEGYQELDKWIANVTPESAAALVTSLLASSNGELLFTLREHNASAANLVDACLNVCLGRKEADALFSTTQIVSRWSTFSNTVLDRAIDISGGPVQLAETLRADGFKAERADLYSRVLRHQGAPDEFVRWCANSLREVSTAQWSAQITADGPQLQLGVDCLRKGFPPKLGSPLRNALLAYATDVMQGKVAAPTDGDCQNVVSLLDRPHAEVLVQQLYESLQEDAGGTSAAFFEAFGVTLQAAGVLREDRSLYTKILEPLIAARNAPGISWIVTALETDPSAVESLTPAQRGVLQETVREALVLAEDGATGPLEALATLVGRLER